MKTIQPIKRLDAVWTLMLLRWFNDSDNTYLVTTKEIYDQFIESSNNIRTSIAKEKEITDSQKKLLESLDKHSHQFIFDEENNNFVVVQHDLGMHEDVKVFIDENAL
jgi:hypothetical protein